MIPGPAELRRDGHAALPPPLSEDALRELTAEYDRTIGRAPLLEVGPDCRDLLLDPDYLWIHSPELGNPRLLSGALESAVLKLASRLCGWDAATIECGLRIFHKPPRCGRGTPLHQDEAYRAPGSAEATLHFWLALDDSHEGNGCMAFVPGSHRGPLLPHVPAPADRPGRGRELLAVGVPSEHAVPCPIGRGQMTVHHARTLHRTGPNPTAEARRALVVVCRHTAAEFATRQPWHSGRMGSWSGR